MVRRAAVPALIASALLSAAPAPASDASGTVESLDGASETLTRVPGASPLVLHFWATWCPSCVDELPLLADAASACAATGVRVLAIDVDEDAATVEAYLAAHPTTLPVRLDRHGKAWRSFGLLGLPASVLISAEGTTRLEGPSTREQWRARLADLGCTPPDD